MRKKRTPVVKVLIALALILSFVGSSLAQKHYKELTYPKLNDIKVPKVERLTLPNGMKLYLLEDHELPLINVSARIRVSSIYESADKIGLAEVAGTVMRTGGTTTKTGDEIDEELERIAASVETGIGLNSGFASASALKKDIDTAFSILADIVMNPAFREDKIELAKIAQRSEIARRNDDVGAIAEREFDKLIYGPDNVYARHPEYSTINNITRDDLVAFHKKYYHPNNVMLGVWGDFDTQEMVKKIEAAFKGWEKADIQFPPVPPVQYEFRQTVNLIRKEDVNQTNIYAGHIGGLMSDPDYFALVVMSRILGSSDTSRLMRNVRSRQGLAYSVFGTYSANFDSPGVFFVGAQTKSESTVQAIRALIEEVKKMTESEVTDEELALAKESYLNSFVFNFDTKGEIVHRLMTYEYFGYPADFLEKTKENIEKVTKADILQVARKHLHPDKLQILAAGRAEEFDQPLSVLGSVREIDITIPTPKEEMPTATAETTTKGRELLSKAVAAMGGSAAFAAVKNVVIKRDLMLVTPQGNLPATATTTFVLPDKRHQVVALPFGEIKQVIAQDQAWIVTPQGVTDAPASEKQDMQAEMFRDWVNLLREAEGLSVQYLGPGEVEGARAETISVTDDKGNTVRLFLDATTFVPLKMAYKGMTSNGPADTEEIYSDLRDVSGIKLPFHVVVNADGKKLLEAKLTEVKINTEIDLSLFQK
ncbi:MAG: insulinase family protein [Acidobacteria bacterium]|nr:insulinase family protein [Acidobacteriota bacterium]